MFASNSPEHIVGNHVLLRLCVPRYPPLALIRLTTFLWSFLLLFLSFPMQFSRFWLVITQQSDSFFQSVAESFPNVEVSGLEPLTSCLQSRRSTN